MVSIPYRKGGSPVNAARRNFSERDLYYYRSVGGIEGLNGGITGGEGNVLTQILNGSKEFTFQREFS